MPTRCNTASSMCEVARLAGLLHSGYPTLPACAAHGIICGTKQSRDNQGLTGQYGGPFHIQS